MTRAELRREIKKELKNKLFRNGLSWRRLRKYLRASRRLSLAKRVLFVEWYLNG